MQSYYRARYYDSSSGRFISEDPIRFEAGINFYPYVGNEPTGFVDSSGLAAKPSPLFGPTFEVIEGGVKKGAGWIPRIVDIGGTVMSVVFYLADPSSVNNSQWANSAEYQHELNAAQSSSGCGGGGPCDPKNFDAYAASAAQLNRGGRFTNAASALQSHAGRGQGFPTVKGPPSVWNSTAQELVEDILTNQMSKCTLGHSQFQGDYVQVQLPGGIGARWTLTGRWIGFIGP